MLHKLYIIICVHADSPLGDVARRARVFDRDFIFVLYYASLSLALVFALYLAHFRLHDIPLQARVVDNRFELFDKLP